MWSFIQKLPLFRYLNVSANTVDKKRVKEIGANAAASEWLLRNGSTFKVENSDNLYKDYNKLPPVRTEIKITEIYSYESTLMDHGFQHLDGLDKVRKIVISSNGFITNGTLRNFSPIKETLEEVTIIDCPFITDDGVRLLADFKKLKRIELSHLLGVENKDECVKHLQSGLPNCEIIWND